MIGRPVRMPAVFAFALADQQKQQLMKIQPQHGLAIQIIVLEFRVYGSDQFTDFPARIHDLPRRSTLGIQLRRKNPLQMKGVLHPGKFGGDQRVVEQDIVKHDLSADDIPCGQFFGMDDDKRVLLEREFPIPRYKEPLSLGDQGDLPELPLKPFAQIEIFRPVLHIPDGKWKIVPEKQLLFEKSLFDPVFHKPAAIVLPPALPGK